MSNIAAFLRTADGRLCLPFYLLRWHNQHRQLCAIEEAFRDTAHHPAFQAAPTVCGDGYQIAVALTFCLFPLALHAQPLYAGLRQHLRLSFRQRWTN